MSFTHGMNIETIRQLAKSFDDQATIVQQLETRINGLVGQAQRDWAGKDSKQFVGEWNNTHRKAILKIKASLDQLADILKRNATSQETTSNEYDSGPSLVRPQPPYSNILLSSTDLSAEKQKLIHDRLDLDLALDAQEREKGKTGIGNAINGFRLVEAVKGTGGFSAYVYEDSFGNKKIVFPGMNPKDVRGDVSSAVGGVVMITDQDRQAIALAKRINESLKDGASLNTIGYSMGGGHAALASIATGTSATTFAAKGASIAAISYAQKAGDSDMASEIFDTIGGVAATAIPLLERSNSELYTHSITNYSSESDALKQVQTPSGPVKDLRNAISIGTKLTGISGLGSFLLDSNIHDALGQQIRIEGSSDPLKAHDLSDIAAGMDRMVSHELQQF